MWGRLRRDRGEPRLDPVRWRRPGRGGLLRLATVAALLATAAALLWYRPQSCAGSTAADCTTAPSETTRPSGAGPSPGDAGPTGLSAAPGQPGADASAPRDSAAGDSTTGDSAPGDSPTGDSAPGDPAPGKSAADASAPGESAAGDSTIGESAAGESAPRDSAAGESAAGESAAGESDSAGSDVRGGPAAGEPGRPGQDDPAAGQGRSAVPAGMVGVPIRLAEPTALRLVRAGDRVDLFRIAEQPQPVASAALVLGVTGTDDPTTGGLLLALTPAEAQRTVTRADHGYAILIRPDG